MSSLHHLWGRTRSHSCQGRLGGVPQSASEGWWTKGNLMMVRTFSNKVTCEYWLRVLSCWMTLTPKLPVRHKAKVTNTIRHIIGITSKCQQGSRIQLVLLEDPSWCWWLTSWSQALQGTLAFLVIKPGVREDWCCCLLLFVVVVVCCD